LGKNKLKKIKCKKLKVIKIPSGDIMRILKNKEVKNWNFAEAYFSKIKYNKIKAWKYHLKMSLNIVVPMGRVKFVFYFNKNKNFKVIELGEKKYSRISIPPRIWFGFKGLSKKDSLILSLTNLEHNPNEVLRCKKNEIKFNW
tara:strand:- start:1923 stop:2348 length:426 start_codon:yes stop_codon:yes gene_type:complete